MSIKHEHQEAVKWVHQYGWTQLIHDRDFHPDIDTLNAKEKQSHFAHHIAKYTPALIDSDGDVSYRILADIMIITTSISNAMRVSHKEVWLPILNNTLMHRPYTTFTRETAELASLRFMANASAQLGKACEALDHIEAYASGKGIKSVVADIYAFVYYVWTDYLGHPFEDLFKLVTLRLLAVEMQHPFYLNIKKTQSASQLGKGIEAYTHLPIRENELIKELNTRDFEQRGQWSLFALDTYEMVLDLPALLSLEKKKLIFREMNGTFSLTQAGKEYVENLI